MVTANDLLPQAVTQLEEEYDPFVEAMLELEEAARRLDLEEWIVNRLRHTERELTVHLPLARDNGEVATFTGFRVQHSSARGPTIGGVSYSPEARASDARARAAATTWQCALFDIPFGGGAGAIVCDPQELSERELRCLTKDYIYALRGLVGAYQDVLIPDAGANERTMAWMLDSYVRAQGRSELGAIVGKPAALWGLPAYGSAAGRGVLCVLEEALAEQNTSLTGKRLAILGFGSVGGAAARMLHEAGARVVAAADRSGALSVRKGLDVPDLLRYVERSGMLFGYTEAEEIGHADVLEAPCDILVAFTGEKQLTAINAPRVRAPIVLEAGRRLTTRGADEILCARGVLVIPEIVGAAGPLLGSFLEWTQNARYRTMGPTEMNESLKARIREAYREVRAAAQHSGSDLRHAASLLAIGRVAAALRLR